MKRMTAFILLLLYLGTSTGASMHFHFCMGEMASSSLWGGDKKKCGKCGMEKEEDSANGCCRDEIQWIKLNDDQKTSVPASEIPKPFPEPKNPVLLSYVLTTLEELPILLYSTAPLRSVQLPTFLLNCVFRI